jgi:transcriptional regulator with XRE-family HTH domain
MTITAGQLRAARAFVKMDQKKMAKLSGVSIPTIKRYEGSDGTLTGSYANVSSLIRVLRESGVEFLCDDGQAGPGVRYRAEASE